MVRLRGIGSSQLAHADGRYGQIRYADKALFWGEASLFSGAGGDNEALQRHFDVGMRHVERSVVVHWEAKETLALASRLAELERESQQLQRSSGALTQQLRIDVGGPDARINSSSERPRRRRSEAVFATSGRNEECHGCTSQPEHRSSGGAIESGPQVPEQLEPVQCQEARRQLPAASSESRSRSATQEYPVHGNELGHYQPEEVSEKESLVARDVDTQHEPLLSRVHEALRSHSTPSSELRSLLHSLAIAHGALLKQQRRMEGERSDVAAEILDLTRSLMLEAPRMQRLQREQAVEAAAAKAREAAVEQSRVLVAKAEADVLRAVSASSAASALVPDSVLDGGNSANRAHLDRLAEAVAAGPTASTLVAAGVLAQLQPLSTADRLRLRLQRSSGTVAAAGHRSGRYARACETLLSLASRTPPPPALPELLTALSALLSADEPSALKCVESNALNSLAPLMVSRESDVAAAALGTLTTLCACCGADPVAAAIKRRGPSPQELMRALVAHLGRGSRHLKPAEAAAAMAALVECMPSAAKIAVTSGALEVLLVRLGSTGCAASAEALGAIQAAGVKMVRELEALGGVPRLVSLLNGNAVLSSTLRAAVELQSAIKSDAAAANVFCALGGIRRLCELIAPPRGRGKTFALPALPAALLLQCVCLLDAAARCSERAQLEAAVHGALTSLLSLLESGERTGAFASELELLPNVLLALCTVTHGQPLVSQELLQNELVNKVRHYATGVDSLEDVTNIANLLLHSVGNTAKLVSL